MARGDGCRADGDRRARCATPELLYEQIARHALDGFYDHTLAARVERYRSDWLDMARQLIAATFDLDRLDGIRRDAELACGTTIALPGSG